MPILSGILLSIGLLFFEGLINGLTAVYVFFSLIIGILISVIINKKMGMAIIITWSIVTDLIYFSILPITTISIIISWIFWNKLIQSKLVANNLAVILLLCGSWLLLFYTFYWLAGWLPYFMENNPLFPDFTKISSYLQTLLINLVIMSGLLFLIRQLSYLFTRK